MEADFFHNRLQALAARYSFLWLVLANAVGLWMSALLLWPGIGRLTGPLGYGRWMPLHMDWNLYGWCSLPIAGLLMRYFLVPGRSAVRHMHGGFAVWSAGLLLLGAMCLSGFTSGKLFLDWSGASRIVFPSAQVFLWGILATHTVRRWREAGRLETGVLFRIGLLLMLAVSPLALFITSGRTVYPPIDPESGGATGHSLLASTLGIISLFGILPWLLRVEPRGHASMLSRVFLGLFLLSVGGWAVLDHGNAANTQPGQVAGLGILLLWIPLIILYYRAFRWEAGLRGWMLAFLFWWMLLTVSGFASFLPRVLELIKFTNALVAHAHLAMAGMITSLNLLLLGSLGKLRAGSPWSDSGSFWMWQTGCAAYVLSMTGQGIREGLDPFVLYGPDTLTNLLYGARFLAGVLMLLASIRWMFLTFSNEPS